MKVIIDRFENNCAVLELENGDLVNAPRALFPEAREGDVFRITKDDTARHVQSERIELLMQELWEDQSTAQ